MKIIARYITKEVFYAFIVVTGILLLIVLSNRFAVCLVKAATGELPMGLALKIVALYIPELLSYLIPLGFFMAILFGLGRLYLDNEMTVLAACGVSFGYIIRLILTFALFIMIMTALFTLWIVPKITQLREEALSAGEAFGVIQSLLPGRFQTFSEGKLVFYLEDVVKKQELLKGILIAERPGNAVKESHSWVLITAKEAQVKRQEKTNNFYLVLKEGYRYQGIPGTANYTVVSFKEYGRAIPYEIEPASSEILRIKNNTRLFNSADPEDIAELQWRLSLPLSVPILALIAISLARVRPRQGRFAKFLPAIVIYIAYYNLFTICRRWVAASVLPGFIGVWWVHGLFMLIGVGLVIKEFGLMPRRT
jgi:lipopolysaccharide export system permease protein